MIKTFTIFTNEVDDIEFAVEDITKQLNEQVELLSNSVGIINCYADFVDSGVYEAVCKTLSFPIAGTTTITNAVRGSSDNILLTIMILTSDDVSFSIGLTEAIEGDNIEVIKDAYSKAAAALPGKPSLILSYVPLLVSVGADFFVRAMDEISDMIPNFGTLAVDHNEDYHKSTVLYNGQAYPDRYAFILIHGNIEPKFFIANISSEKVFNEKGIVTASEGNRLKTVNNIPVGDYLAGLGLKRDADGSIIGINSFPFLMDLNDGSTPVVRCMFALTPDGAAVCGGEVPVGATLTVGSINMEEVIATTEERMRQALASKQYSTFLMYSCVGRYFSLAYNPTSEMDKIHSMLAEEAATYSISYSGGEICPVYINNTDKTANRIHNDTLVICAF